jgi:hypothetical protein
MKTIYVHTNTPLVGDTLCTLPFLRYLHELHGADIIVGPHFNQWVYASLNAPWLQQGVSCATEYWLDADNAMRVGAREGCHMAAAYFGQHGLRVTDLPFDLRDMFLNPDAEVHGDFIAIAPFSRTDIGGNKAWPINRWVQFARLCEDVWGLPVYAFGTTKDFEQASGFAFHTAPVCDKPLWEVLAYFRQARAVVTIDTGLSHLCHFGCIAHHALLYPKCLSPEFVTNPRGKNIWSYPAEVSVEDMLNLTKEVMRS